MTSEESTLSIQGRRARFSSQGRSRLLHFLSLQDYQGAGGIGSMREREVYGTHVQLLRAGRSAAVQQQTRPPRREPDDFDIAPAAGRAHAGAQCLEEGFLGRETSRQRLRGIGVPQAIRQLAIGKQPLQRALAAALRKSLESINADEVETGT